MNELGSRLRLARQRKNLTLETIGRRAGISKSYVSDLERGRLVGANRDVIKAIVVKGLGERWEDWEAFVEETLWRRQLTALLRGSPNLTDAGREAIERFVEFTVEQDRRATEEKRQREESQRRVAEDKPDYS